MSRAFVKEDADAPEPPLPERPISAAPNRVTPRGAGLIAEAIAALKDELARSPDEKVAAAIRRDLRYWHSRRASMHVIAPKATPEVASFGTRITIRRGSIASDITIVGEDEADPSTGLIAWTAPLARAVENAEVGDVVELEAGGRREPITVVAIASGAVS
jgi:transcription elongation GreA/GreB family factor